MMKHLLVIFVSGAVALGAAACSGSSPSSPSSPSANGSRLLVRLTAGPFTPAKAVLFTFSRVRAYRGSPTNFTDVPLSGGGGQYTCDLAKLTTSDGEIAVGTLPAGAYSQIGLVLQSVTLYIDNPTGGAPCAASIPAPSGRSATLAVPAGEIPLPHNFDVTATADTVLRLEVDTEQSIHVTGDNTFSLTPVINVVSVP